MGQQVSLTDITDFLQDCMDSLIQEGGVSLTDIIDFLKDFMDSLVEGGVASQASSPYRYHRLP